MIQWVLSRKHKEITDHSSHRRAKGRPSSLFVPETASDEPTLGYFGKGLGDDQIPEMVPGTQSYKLSTSWRNTGVLEERKGWGREKGSTVPFIVRDLGVEDLFVVYE